MTTAKKKPGAPEIEDNLQYSVTLLETIQIGSALIGAGTGVVLKGRVIKGLKDGAFTDLVAQPAGG